MGIKESKSIKTLKEKGVNAWLAHIKSKTRNKILAKVIFGFNKIVYVYFIYIYSKYILDKTQYQDFILLRTYFNENYKNIIISDCKFFKNFLKNHIEWLNSKEFKEIYGDIKNIVTTK